MLHIFVGKFVVGYMPVGGEKEYYLASACAELYAPPSAYVALYGLTIQQTFLRGNCMYSDNMIPLVIAQVHHHQVGVIFC